ncbi:MAG: MarR family winged helix-turn-helix transcriptional regulator [Candidatus Limnocylindrales bacterium]
MKASVRSARDGAPPPLADAPASEHSPDDVASVILEGVPLIMRAIRARMREGRPAGISVAQFRALLYLRRRPGSGLSEIADQLGTSVPAASELVSRLVREDLVERELDPLERRRIRLTLSPAGAAQLDRAQEAAASWVRAMVRDLDPGRQRAIVEAIVELLRLVVASGPPSDAGGEPGRRREGG